MAVRGEHRQNVEGPSAPRVTVAVLGPTTVTVEGDERTITAHRQRAVLACLALHPDEPLSADRLLDEVWGDDLPDTGPRAVAHQIAKLRTLLEPDRTGEGTVITTTDAGYSLHIDPVDVDAIAFERLVTDARATLDSDPDRSEKLVTEALASWRGRPFADLADEPFVDHHARRLDHLHLLARRTLAEARIAQGHPSEVTGELESLVADHPLEESLVRLLMTALHQAGRTADALRAYADLRRRLSAELGIEPAHELQHLEQQLLTADDQSGTSTPRSEPRPRPVPAPLTTFVGRTEELARIQDLLASARLVTLVGFGGLGKTRLAQETARTVGNKFRDGVWYVDLTPILDPTVLADTIVAAGGLTVPPGRDPVQHLLVRLADREALLVLDNCEHLAEGVAELATSIVRTAPDVRVLATSRVTLGIAGETLRPVRPLDAESALDLFTARARLVRPGFACDDTNRSAIKRLIDGLDGIPLAIEMVAARLAVLSVEQILEHLDDRFDLLTRTHPSADDRQRSVAAVMEWSYDLLDEEEQELLRRMSVCAGGFDLDAAIQVGLAEPSTVSLDDVLDRLGNLVEASLVLFDEDQGTPRYQMLETVRQFAAAQLDTDERDEVARAHAKHYEAVAIQIFDLASTDWEAVYRLGDHELDNLRAAMTWANRSGEPHLGLSIACNARFYFQGRFLTRELLRTLRTGLELVESDDDGTLEAAAYTLIHAHVLDDLDTRELVATRVTRGIDTAEDPRLRAELLNALAGYVSPIDPQAAVTYTKAALELRASVPYRTVALLHNRITDALTTGDLDDGEAILRRLAEIQRSWPGGAPSRYMIEAGVAACAGRWHEVLRIVDSADDADPIDEIEMQFYRAEALGALDRRDEALATIQTVEAFATQEDVNYYHGSFDFLHASIELRHRKPRTAARMLNSLADEVARDGRRLAIGMKIAALLAVAANDLGQHETAAILFGYSAAEQERLDIVLRLSDRPLAERAIAGCRAALGDDRFDELAEQGADTEWRDLPRPTTSTT